MALIPDDGVASRREARRDSSIGRRHRGRTRGHEHDQGAAEQCAVATWLPRHHVAPPLTKVATQGRLRARLRGDSEENHGDCRVQPSIREFERGDR